MRPFCIKKGDKHMSSIRDEIPKIKQYIIAKHKAKNHYNYLYKNGKPYRELCIVKNSNGSFTATCYIRCNYGEKEIRLFKQNGKWEKII